VADFACRVCQTPFLDAYPLDEHDLCTVCRGSEVSFDAAYSFGSYEGVLRDLIRLFKYSRIESLSKPLGRFLLSAVPRGRSFDIVAPMPMHWFRRWQRGFNQAELLAQPIARAYRLPVSPVLRRVRLGRRQAGLAGQARYKNLQGAFQVARGARVQGKRVLLIDDVLTTGSTLAAAAAVLKAAGAAEVCALTVARVMRRGGLPDLKPGTNRDIRKAKLAAGAKPPKGSRDYGEL
jgi:ComF family protein